MTRKNINRLPNFFIVGAPRAGTTAMFHYLGQHPQVFVPAEIKEPHYFGRDLRLSLPRMSLAEYQQLFHLAGDRKAIGEASVMYLMSKTAAEEIKAVCGSARIIIMLRNPVDLLISLHRKMLLTGNEDIDDLEIALEAEQERKEGRRLPPFTQLVSLLEYSEVVNFADQLQRYVKTFGKDNVHIIWYDDLRSDAEMAYRKVLSFLGLDPVFIPQFKVVNKTMGVRFRLLRDMRLLLILKSPAWFKSVVKALTPIGWRRKVGTTIEQVCKAEMLRSEVKHDLRLQLRERLCGNILELSELSGKDLRHWLEK